MSTHDVPSPPSIEEQVAAVPAPELISEPPAKPRIRDFIGSFTGWDEIAIEQRFRKDFGDLSKMMTGRAAAFILLRRRDGMDDKSAFKASMDMSLQNINDLFDTSDEEEEDDVWPGKG